VGGKANAAVLALLAAALPSVRKKDVAIVSGERARDKVLRVPLPAAAVLAALQEYQ